jgi:hypothetical protein
VYLATETPHSFYEANAMKSLMWALATIFVAIINMQSVRAQSFELQFPITCGPSENFVTNLKNQYDEEMIMMAGSLNEKGETLYHSLWINAETRTWTFVVANVERKTSCVLGSGDGMNMVYPSSGNPT